MSSWQQSFADRVAQLTGLDVATVLGWEQVEGGPADNPLNIGPGRHYGTTDAAAAATGALLNTPLYSDVELVAHRHYANENARLQAQAVAIAASPWNDPNGAGSMSRSSYANAIYTDAQHAGGSSGGGGIGGAILGGIGDAVGALPVVGPVVDAAGNLVGGIGGVGSAIVNVVKTPVDFAIEVWDVLSAQSTWIRVGFFAGGLVLVVLAFREAFA